MLLMPKAPIKLVDIAVTYGMGNTTCVVSNASGITKANAAQLEGKKSCCSSRNYG